VSVKIVNKGSRIAILPNSPLHILGLGHDLRVAIGNDKVFAMPGGYLVSLESINILARILPPDSNDWDDSLLQRGTLVWDTLKGQKAARQEVDQALAAPYEVLKDYKEIGRLDPHQVSAVAAMVSPSLKGLALFDEQGTGKTICAIATFDILRQRGILSHLLVIAPKSVLIVWEKEVREFLGGKYSVLRVGGGRTDRLKILGERDILLASYEAVTRSSVLLQGLMTTKGRKFMIVVDESYFVKNPGSQRSKAITTVRQWCERAYVLCGTPAPNAPVDVVNQVNVTDIGATFSGVRIPKDDEQAKEVIKDALGQSAIYLRRLKEEVLPDIPNKNIKKTIVELSPIQADLYQRELNSLVDDVSQTDEAYFIKHLGQFLARKWSLLQICSNPGAIIPSYSEDPAKLIALDELIEDMVKKHGQKVVVWSFFTFSLQRIFDRYTGFGAVRIDGSVTSIEERARAIERFQHDPAIMVFVGNPAAAGAGITLTASSTAVYESFSNQPAHYLQSVDRIHRRGQKNEVNSFILISKGTIEEHEFQKLMEKERRGHSIFGSMPREPITKEGFLKDLLMSK